MDFVNLYVQSEYTMLGSPIKLHDLIAKCHEDGQNSVAICDLNNMHGAFKFYNLAKSHNIKPIIGLHTKVESKLNFFNVLLVYAKDAIGYKNLLALASIAKIKGSVTYVDLQEHNKNVLAILPSDESEIIKLYNENDLVGAKRLTEYYKQIIPDLYLGIDLQTESNKINAQGLIEFAHNNGIKPVALNKTNFLNKADFEIYQVLRCIDLGINEYPYSEKETNSYFLSKEEAINLFNDYPELINNTLEVANKCQLEIEMETYKFPVFPDSNRKSFEYLTQICKVGLNKRIMNKKVDANKYKERLLYELNIINKMGFCDYFLIVYDYVKYAKKNGILVGPGRGSAPGSLVAYCLGITEIDPIEYDLLFERFLNPERITMPDIDIDFPDNKRDQVIQYVLNKYGKNRVAHITTFGTFGVRLAVRDVARVFKLNDVIVNEILKFVNNNDVSIQEIIDTNERFRNLTMTNEVVGRLARIVSKIEGLPRHTSTHAAGIIMAGDDLVNYTPLQEGINGLYQTQYEAVDLESIGLVKMDFLGIRNLTIIDDVVNKIRETKPDFNINKIPLDDKYTYQMIASGDTDGIFQLESPGMRNVLMGLKTSSFMDIVHANALYRPGPMEMIPSFTKRKLGLEPVDYIDESLKDILEPTYGIIVFQEQIMLLVQKFAGYTLGMADILRRAVSKKKAEVLNNERLRFVQEAVKLNHSEELANKVYDYIVKFANYGFNKSHSVAYSMIAYQMAYLKRRYYRYFMATLMSNSIGSVNLIRNYLNDCKKKKVDVYLPSVNYSEANFVVKNNGIYYSLLGIQNLGALTLTNFLKERRENGPYQSYENFVDRTKDILNKRIVESMIHAGALDEFKIPRKQMVLEYDNALRLSKYNSLVNETLIPRQYSDEEYSFEEISFFEREALGFNFKYSIFSKYQSMKEKFHTTDIGSLNVGKNIRILFAIRNIREIKTKNNQEMAFVQIYDDSDQIDGTIFPNVYANIKNMLSVNNVYFAEGSVDIRNDRKQFVINKINILK